MSLPSTSLNHRSYAAPTGLALIRFQYSRSDRRNDAPAVFSVAKIKAVKKPELWYGGGPAGSNSGVPSVSAAIRRTNHISCGRIRICSVRGHLRHFSLKTYCNMSISSDQSDSYKKTATGHHIMYKARSLWKNCPEPVKTFPWDKALDNFIQLVLDLFLSVLKCLSGPVFAITSISELSYCAHERQLHLVPVPFLAGAAFAGVLRDASLESSPYLKYAEAPWHLITSVVFFAFLKFLGPYYIHWGRVLVPHFANGALLRTLWFMFLWYRRPKKYSGSKPVPDGA